MPQEYFAHIVAREQEPVTHALQMPLVLQQEKSLLRILQMVQDAFQVRGVLHCLLIALKEQVPGKLGLVLGVRLEPVPEVKQEQMEQELGMMQLEFVQAQAQVQVQVQAMRLPGQALELVLVVELAHLVLS